ncbi:PIG-L family deacetylase (plasmid) [Streptomyces viridifaciens]|nr:PIG-L family deacetylase [Streptomyces viridifaciens]
MNALVIAAHPDDEVLGAGGTIASLAARGWHVSILILAEGISLRHAGMSLKAARRNCRTAASRLGVEDVQFGGFSADNKLLADGEQRPVVATIERALTESEPSLVLTHHPGDIHADHRMVAHSVSYATRLLGLGSVSRVLHFEVLSSTEQQPGLVAPFTPNVFVDVTGFIDAKCDALEVYSYETFDVIHPRSVNGIRALANYRGVQLGVREAEAFALGRELVRF